MIKSSVQNNSNMAKNCVLSSIPRLVEEQTHDPSSVHQARSAQDIDCRWGSV